MQNRFKKKWILTKMRRNDSLNPFDIDETLKWWQQNKRVIEIVRIISRNRIFVMNIISDPTNNGKIEAGQSDNST